MTPDQTTIADAATTDCSQIPAPHVAITAEQWLGWARDAHSVSQTYFDSSVRQGVVDAIKQASSIHKAGSKYYQDEYRARSRLFRPKTKTAIVKNEASAAEAFFSTKDLIEITAEDDGDDLNVAASKFMKELLSYRLKKSMPWFQTVLGAYQEAQTVGVVCSYQDWEYDKRRKPKPLDRPACKLIPVENIRVDPACDWTDPIGSSPYVIHEIPMYVKDVKARIRGTDPNKPTWYEVSDAQLLASTSKSMDTVRATRENKRTDSKSQAGAITDFTIVWVHRNIMMVDGEDWVYYTLGTSMLLSDPQTIDKVYWTGMRPYVMGCYAIEAHRTYPGGLPAMTSEIQAEINELANTRQDNVKFVLNKRWFAKRNQQVDVRSLVRNIPGSVTLMNDVEKDVKIVDTPDVTASAYKEMDMLNVDFDDMAGGFNQGTVQTNKNLNETVGGLELLDEKANQIGNYRLRIFSTTWLQPVLRQLMALESHYESDKTVMVLCAKACKLNVPKEQGGLGIDQIDNDLLLQDLILNVDTGQGSTNPTARMALLTNGMGTIRNTLADGLLEQHGLKVTEFIGEVMGISGYKDAEKFFSVDVDPTVQSLQQQLQQAKDEAAKKSDPPEITAGKVKLLEAQAAKESALALQANITAGFEAIQGAGLIASSPGLAPIADAIMKAGGYQVPTPAGDNPHYESGMDMGQSGAIPQIPGPVPGVEPPADSGNSDSSMPAKPATGAVGAQAGIETPRNEGADATAA